jgi:hypothetical protein
MRLDPLRAVYVQPAPKSRLAAFEPSVYEDQKQKAKSKAKADQRLPG